MKASISSGVDPDGTSSSNGNIKIELVFDLFNVVPVLLPSQFHIIPRFDAFPFTIFHDFLKHVQADSEHVVTAIKDALYVRIFESYTITITL